MPGAENCLIIFRICSKDFSSRFTSSTFTPAPEKTEAALAAFRSANDADSVRAAIEDGFDIKSEKRVVWQPGRILTVADTDRGERIREQIADLECLLEAYRTGEIQEA